MYSEKDICNSDYPSFLDSSLSFSYSRYFQLLDRRGWNLELTSRETYTPERHFWVQVSTSRRQFRASIRYVFTILRVNLRPHVDVQVHVYKGNAGSTHR